MGKKERRRLRKKRRRIEIPEEISKKLGEANMMYALEDYTGAVEILKEVVRTAPEIPDSYHTFGLVCEAMGDQRKALNFYMIAAHLTPNDVEQWQRVAQMAKDMGNYRQAIYCLSKLIRLDKEKVDRNSRWERANLYAEIQDNSKAKEAFEQLHRGDPEDIEVVKMLARVYHRLGHHTQAIELLENQLEEYSETCDFTVVNILCELYMEDGDYTKTLELVEDAENTLCTEEESLPVDLQVKAGLCMMHLGNVAEAMEVLNPLAELDVDQYADLFMDVADTCWAKGELESAYPFYAALRTIQDYDQPALWSRLEHCLQSSGRTEEAIEMYLNVLDDIDKDHPGYAEANLSLANLYRESKRYDHALQAVQESEAFREVGNLENEADVQQVISRAQLHFSLGSYKHFLDIALPLVQRSLENINKDDADLAEDDIEQEDPGWQGSSASKKDPAPPEDGVFLGYRSRDRRKRRHGMVAGETGPRGASQLLVPLPGVLKHKNTFQVFLDVGRVSILNGRYEETSRLIQMALSSGRALRGAKKRQVRFLALGLGSYLVNCSFAQECLVHAASQRPESIAVWNLLSRWCNLTGSFQKCASFFHKMRARHPENALAMIMAGHCHLVAGSYLEAMDEYLNAINVLGEDCNLVRLCLGVATLQHAMSRRTLDRSNCLAKAFACLHLHEKEENDGIIVGFEAYQHYNWGRAAHHLGLLTPATRFYRRVIDSIPFEGDEDVRFAAAHNLALIYAASGAQELASELRKKHCGI